MTQLMDTYLFCTACKSKLNQSGNSKTCPQCGKQYYFNALPNVTVVVTNKRNELLLFQRAQEPFKGWWDMPGGFVSEGESLEQAAIRETREETGATVRNPQYITSVPEKYVHREVTYNLVFILFGAQLEDESELRVSDESVGYRLFPKESVPLDEVAFDAQRAFLKSYLS